MALIMSSNFHEDPSLHVQEDVQLEKGENGNVSEPNDGADANVTVTVTGTGTTDQTAKPAAAASETNNAQPANKKLAKGSVIHCGRQKRIDQKDVEHCKYLKCAAKIINRTRSSACVRVVSLAPRVEKEGAAGESNGGTDHIKILSTEKNGTASSDADENEIQKSSSPLETQNVSNDANDEIKTFCSDAGPNETRDNNETGISSTAGDRENQEEDNKSNHENNPYSSDVETNHTEHGNESTFLLSAADQVQRQASIQTNADSKPSSSEAETNEVTDGNGSKVSSSSTDTETRQESNQHNDKNSSSKEMQPNSIKNPMPKQPENNHNNIQSASFKSRIERRKEKKRKKKWLRHQKEEVSIQESNANTIVLTTSHFGPLECTRHSEPTDSSKPVGTSADNVEHGGQNHSQHSLETSKDSETQEKSSDEQSPSSPSSLQAPTCMPAPLSPPKSIIHVKPLIILDINGILCHRVRDKVPSHPQPYPPPNSRDPAASTAETPTSSKSIKFRRSWGVISRTEIIPRSDLEEFLNLLHDHFSLAVWTSATPKTAKFLVRMLFPPKVRDRLVFVWHRNFCKLVDSIEGKDRDEVDDVNGDTESNEKEIGIPFSGPGGKEEKETKSDEAIHEKEQVGGIGNLCLEGSGVRSIALAEMSDEKNEKKRKNEASGSKDVSVVSDPSFVEESEHRRYDGDIVPTNDISCFKEALPEPPHQKKRKLEESNAKDDRVIEVMETNNKGSDDVAVEKEKFESNSSSALVEHEMAACIKVTEQKDDAKSMAPDGKSVEDPNNESNDNQNDDNDNKKDSIAGNEPTKTYKDVIAIKCLSKVWSIYPLWNASNTLLLDDSPEKCPMQYRGNSLHPPPICGTMTLHSKKVKPEPIPSSGDQSTEGETTARGEETGNVVEGKKSESSKISILDNDEANQNMQRNFFELLAKHWSTLPDADPSNLSSDPATDPQSKSRLVSFLEEHAQKHHMGWNTTDSLAAKYSDTTYYLK